MPSANDKQRKAVVIDDDPFIREMLQSHLTQNGFSVYAAANGREGISRLKEDQDISLIVTDMIMPDKEGLETILYVRQRRPSVKIIAISGGGAFGAHDLLGYAQKLGANATLPKPINFDEFDRIIQSFN